ncbi:stage II sporulation protein P [Sporosarcina sp. CAU 1771]
MKKTLQIWSSLILFLFLFPLIINYLPEDTTAKSINLLKESREMVFAANIMEESLPEPVGRKALLYFTHNYEAYEPITKAKNGKVSVSHQSENIKKFGEKLKVQLDFSGISTDILPVDNQLEMQKNKIKYGRSYKAIRPYVEKQLQEESYDLIIDMHRDSVKSDVTTMVHEGEKYAKVAFVIGLDHPNYKKNKKMAELLKSEMEQLVPGITRNMILKDKHEGDGKYNQDLDPSIILLELGGIGNQEEELNRTVSVIAEAAASILSES